jgi:hypothetical protein
MAIVDTTTQFRIILVGCTYIKLLIDIFFSFDIISPIWEFIASYRSPRDDNHVTVRVTDT